MIYSPHSRSTSYELSLLWLGNQWNPVFIVFLKIFQSALEMFPYFKMGLLANNILLAESFMYLFIVMIIWIFLEFTKEELLKIKVRIEGKMLCATQIFWE